MAPEKLLRDLLVFGFLAASLAAGIWLFCWGGKRLPSTAGGLAQLCGGLVALGAAAFLVTAVLIVFFGLRLEG
jgi:hypothetical protein